jgi:hypothetical protein
MTPALLKNATLERIGKAPAGGPYPAEDVAKVTEKYVGLHAMLLEMNLVTWAVDEIIPPKVEQPVLAMLSFLCAAEFNVPEPRYSRLRSEGSLGDERPSLAERQLRRILSQRYVPHTVMTEFM